MKITFIGGGNMARSLIGGLVAHGQPPESIHVAEPHAPLREALAHDFSCRGYYGTLRHNIKAVYQFYLGWWDGNPATYHNLPPVESGKRLVRAYLFQGHTLWQSSQP